MLKDVANLYLQYLENTHILFLPLSHWGKKRDWVFWKRGCWGRYVEL